MAAALEPGPVSRPFPLAVLSGNISYWLASYNRNVLLAGVKSENCLIGRDIKMSFFHWLALEHVTVLLCLIGWHHITELSGWGPITELSFWLEFYHRTVLLTGVISQNCLFGLCHITELSYWLVSYHRTVLLTGVISQNCLIDWCHISKLSYWLVSYHRTFILTGVISHNCLFDWRQLTEISY